MIKGKNVTVSFTDADGKRHELIASDFKVDDVETNEPMARVRVATPEEAQQYVDALNNQPRGTCVKPGCGKERAPWYVSAGSVAGFAFCPEHIPKLV